MMDHLRRLGVVGRFLVNRDVSLLVMGRACE
jgi:hypothetical protein